MNAVFPGSFDPFTLGHYNIIKRAEKLFDKIFVAVAEDTGKQTIPLATRVELARLTLKDTPKAEVLGFYGLTTDFAIENDCGVILRGVRGAADILYEQNLYSEYKRLAALKSADLEIIYLISDLNHVSSSEVRRRVKEGLSLKGYVSENILNNVINLYK